MSVRYFENESSERLKDGFGEREIIRPEFMFPVASRKLEALFLSNPVDEFHRNGRDPRAAR